MKSSLFTNIFILGINLLIGIISAFYGEETLCYIFSAMFIFFGFVRLWGELACKNIDVTFVPKSTGVFPGEKLYIDINISNDKLLPVSSIELSIEDYTEKCFIYPKEQSKQFPKLGAFTDIDTQIALYAIHRGTYDLSSWEIYCGDGLSLFQKSLTVPNNFILAVYPKIQKVSTEIFLRNLWNSETGSHGIMSDPTVIRSNREYQPGDNVKAINWRLLARNQPLSVNVYDDILPQSVHFIFDGESYMGPNTHRVDMENALSVLGSVILKLQERQIDCSISLSKGSYNGSFMDDIFFSLASYVPSEIALDNNEVVLQEAKYDIERIENLSHSVGHFYYIGYSIENIKNKKILSQLENTGITLLLTKENKKACEWECIPISSIAKQ